MKFLSASLAFLALVLNSCSNNSNKTNTSTELATNKDSTDNFFPVTNFIKGEILGIKQIGITPIKKTIQNKKVDSVWLKQEELEITLAEFLNPVIDTANLKDYFKEEKFLDQTLNTYTFTYAAKPNNNFSFAFKNWDVFVDPESGKITRLYLVKQQDANTILQLTWLCNKYAKIITLKNNSIIKEEQIAWSFN
jgi:hypothetical protein